MMIHRHFEFSHTCLGAYQYSGAQEGVCNWCGQLGESGGSVLSSRALIGYPENIRYIHGEERCGAKVIMTIPTKTILHQK